MVSRTSSEPAMHRVVRQSHTHGTRIYLKQCTLMRAATDASTAVPSRPSIFCTVQSVTSSEPAMHRLIRRVLGI